MEDFNNTKIETIEKQILAHREAYYKGEPLISDEEYDILEEELRVLSPNSQLLQSVGHGKANNINKVKHDTPMLSLNKTYSIEELKNWIGDNSILVTNKLDGVSLSLVYANNNLILAKTRGDGEYGEVATAKASFIKNVQKTLKNISAVLENKPVQEVRGEVVCTLSDFNLLCEEMEKLSLPVPSNRRNIVAGLLSRKDHVFLCKYLTFCPFDIISDYNLTIEPAKFVALSQLGFDVSFVDWEFFSKVDDSSKLYNSLTTPQDLLSEDREVLCDGLVFTLGDINKQHEAGYTSHHPRFKLAFKWLGKTAVTTIKAINWFTSRNGVVTPVAVVEPVNLSGATITNVTLHNYKYILDNKLTVGDTIEIVRSGEVIPKYVKTIKKSGKIPHTVVTCPSCGTDLVSKGPKMYCVNGRDKCIAKIIGSIENWIRVLEIDDINRKRVTSFVENLNVATPLDLYSLTKEDLLKLEKVGEKLANKLIVNIRESKKPPLYKFMTALGVENVGSTIWKKIVRVCPKLDLILDITLDTKFDIKGIGESTLKSIVTELEDIGHDYIRALYNTVGAAKIEHEPSATVQNLPLTNMNIVVTGALSKPRKQVEKLITENGGKLCSGISKTTNVIVTNNPDTTSSKMKKANKLGIPVWNEAKLLEFLGI